MLALPVLERIDDIRSWLARAGVTEPCPFTAADLRAGVTVTHGPDSLVDVVIRSEPQFQGFQRRSTPLAVAPDRAEPVVVSLVEAGDCVYGWHPRDRDHLAVQRAIRVAAEQTE